MPSIRTRFGLTTLAGLIFACTIPACDGSSGLEKPPDPANAKPDMNKMPGFNEMQEKLKKEGKAK